MRSRIEWSPDSARLLVCRDGLRIHALDGSELAVLAADPHHDARWLADGRIAALDRFLSPVHFTMQGERDGELEAQPASVYTGEVEIAACGTAYIQNNAYQTCVRSMSSRAEVPWVWASYRYNVQPDGPLAATISADGRAVAIGYETRPWQDEYQDVAGGRGLLVIDITPHAKRDPSAPDTVMDRLWYEAVRDAGGVRLAFDRGTTRRRLAIATPDRDAPGIGALRIGGPGAYPRTHEGGAHAVAIDARGVRAAFAYPKHLRIDYLAPQAKGTSVIEILETLRIDPDIGELAELAFDPPGHRIACLTRDGRIEVVPVP